MKFFVLPPVDSSAISIPIAVESPQTPAVAGEPYTLECRVGMSNLNNSDIRWIGPNNIIISSTSSRVVVGDVSTDANGNSVRTLTFNPLSTSDSAVYRCEHTSANVAASETLTVGGT